MRKELSVFVLFICCCMPCLFKYFIYFDFSHPQFPDNQRRLQYAKAKAQQRAGAEPHISIFLWDLGVLFITSEMACKRNGREFSTFQGSMVGLSEGDLIFTQLSFSSSPFTSDILLAFHCRDVFMAIITYSCKLVFFLFCSIALQLFYGLWTW